MTSTALITGEDAAATPVGVAKPPQHLGAKRLKVMPVNQSFAGLRIVSKQ
jgi:hypothetical protein